MRQYITMEKLRDNEETTLNVRIGSHVRDEDLLGFYLSIFTDIETIQTTIWPAFEAINESVPAD